MIIETSSSTTTVAAVGKRHVNRTWRRISEHLQPEVRVPVVIIFFFFASSYLILIQLLNSHEEVHLLRLRGLDDYSAGVGWPPCSRDFFWEGDLDATKGYSHKPMLIEVPSSTTPVAVVGKWSGTSVEFEAGFLDHLTTESSSFGCNIFSFLRLFLLSLLISLDHLPGC
jgi:hypothetical protein